MCSICELGDVTGQSSEDLVQLKNAKKLLFGKISRATFAKNSKIGSNATVTMIIVVFCFLTRVIS
jgi:hypothetical protein